MNRINELEKLILKHKALYYQGRPEISDAEFDSLENELKEKNPHSKVLNIVGSLVKSSEKIKHDKKMLSLDKTYIVDDLVTWMGKEEIVSTLKLDGISCSLIFENGDFVLAKTRGDGTFGENITQKVLWIGNIPKHLSYKGKVEIRGELFCDEESFLLLAEEMEKLNLERPTSQRNIVAGLMGRKENLELCRYIKFMGFDVITETHFNLETDKFEFLKKEEFLFPEFRVHKDKESLYDVIDFAKHFMSEGDYQIDGIVFTYNKNSLHEELGETAHHPRYKIAFKFQGEAKETILNTIVWSVSRNGILTPVGDVTPVELSGAMISRVTLHNYGVVKANRLKSGDKISIIRSGEVIPKFLEVITPSTNLFEIPSSCPSCESPVLVKDIRLYCSNEKCPGRNKEVILNYIQKIGVEDLSGKRLEELLNAGFVKTIPDLYRLTADDLMKLDKVKDKLSQKLIESIQKTKHVDFIIFLSSLGITGGAYNKCEKVVRAGFDSVEKIKNLTIEKLMNVDSFAEKSATEFVNSIKEKSEMIDELVGLGMTFEIEETRNTAVSGLKICITGALSQKRNVIEDAIRLGGGLVVSSVSKNTDLLVTNETDPTSSKYKKALELKIKIITEAQLMDLLN